MRFLQDLPRISETEQKYPGQKLIQIKPLQKGDKVGYESTFKPKRNMTIGILPAGYCDGLDRRLSNKGFVKINGSICKIIGLVSMNITTIDITDIKDAKVGDEVIIFSKNPSDINSISSSAAICKTIPYDLLVHLAASTRREIINGS